MYVTTTTVRIGPCSVKVTFIVLTVLTEPTHSVEAGGDQVPSRNCTPWIGDFGRFESGAYALGTRIPVSPLQIWW